jgi:hypothetical protein
VYAITGLAAGNYHLFTNSSNEINEIHPDLLCLNFCSSSTP